MNRRNEEKVTSDAVVAQQVLRHELAKHFPEEHWRVREVVIEPAHEVEIEGEWIRVPERVRGTVGSFVYGNVTITPEMGSPTAEGLGHAVSSECRGIRHELRHFLLNMVRALEEVD